MPPSRFPELAFIEASEGLPTSGTWIGYPLLHDFTADGRADLVASNREEDGFNAWVAPEKGPWIRRIEGLPRDMAYGPACGGDVNGDGKPDLLLSAHTDALRIYLNDGQMEWTRAESAIENPFLMLDVAVGDLDGDSHLDVVGVGHFKGGVSAFLGDGRGGFARLGESASIMSTNAFGRDIELADVDVDGTPDIIATTNQGLKVFLTRRDKGATHRPLRWENRSAGLPAPKIGNSISSVVVGRFTDSVQPQVVTCAVPDPSDKPEDFNAIGVYAWVEDSQQWSQIDRGLARNEAYRDVRAADFNGDGKLDLLAMSVQSGGVIYLGDGTGSFEAKGRLPGVSGRGRVALGDIDADGRVDVAVAVPATKDDPKAGGVRAFLNRDLIWQ